jgi:hypothetical protein
MHIKVIERNIAEDGARLAAFLEGDASLSVL